MITLGELNELTNFINEPLSAIVWVFLVVVVVQLLSHVQVFVIPWTVALQASLSFTISCSLVKLMSIESVMPSNHLILCHPLLLLTSIFPSIRVFQCFQLCPLESDLIPTLFYVTKTIR